MGKIEILASSYTFYLMLWRKFSILILLYQFLSFKCEIAKITWAEWLFKKLNNFITFNLFFTYKYRLIPFNIV
jgi:hypothetical protein